MRHCIPPFLVVLVACPSPAPVQEGPRASVDAGHTSAARVSPGCREHPKLVRTLEDFDGAVSFIAEYRDGYRALERLGTTPDQLLAVARDAGCSNRARFRAFEAWFYRVGGGRVRKLDEPTAQAMVEVYAEAMKLAVDPEEGAIWGSPLNVRGSPSAKHLILLGKRVLPYLRPFFDDHRRIVRVGGEGARWHNLHHFRLSDLAGAIVAEVLGEPQLFPTEGTTQVQRDVALTKLARRLDGLKPCHGNPGLVRLLEGFNGVHILIGEYSKGHRALERLGVAPEQLLAVALDDACTNRARFAAFETWLWRVGSGRVRGLDDRTAQAMIRVYVEAMKLAVGPGEGEIWGSPLNVRGSPSAKHLILLGKRVLPHLRPFFDDRRKLLRAGSEGATLHDMHHFRVCDLAGAIVANVLRKPRLFPTEGSTLKERDAALEELARRLDAMQP